MRKRDRKKKKNENSKTKEMWRKKFKQKEENERKRHLNRMSPKSDFKKRMIKSNFISSANAGGSEKLGMVFVVLFSTREL